MRLSIEDQFFTDTRVRKLAKILGISQTEAEGHLIRLWYHSQRIGRVSGSEEEILEWSWAEDRPELIEGLLKSRLLSLHNDGVYKISGNDKHLKGISDWRSKQASKGVKRASSAKRDSNGRFLKTAPATHQPGEKWLDRNANLRCRKTTSHGSQPENLAGKNEQNETDDLDCEVEVLEPTSPATAGRLVASHTTHDQPISISSIYNNISPSLRSGDISTTAKNAAGQKWLNRQTDFDRQLGQEWFDWSKQQRPKGKFKLDKFVEAISRFRYSPYDLTEQQIRFVFDFIRGDEFWSANALSPDRLRAKSKSNPDLTKLDQIILALKRRKKSRSERTIEVAASIEHEVEDGLKFLES